MKSVDEKQVNNNEINETTEDETSKNNELNSVIESPDPCLKRFFEKKIPNPRSGKQTWPGTRSNLIRKSNVFGIRIGIVLLKPQLQFCLDFLRS